VSLSLELHAKDVYSYNIKKIYILVLILEYEIIINLVSEGPMLRKSALRIGNMAKEEFNVGTSVRISWTGGATKSGLRNRFSKV
jgi:hypothetical protein